MTRTYAVKYKSKSKMLTTPEQVAQTEEDIKALALVKDAVILSVSTVLLLLSVLYYRHHC